MVIDLKSVKISDIETEFKSKIDSLVQEVNDLWSDFKVKDALVKTNEIVKLGNKYINDEKPWSSENHSEILNNLHYLISEVNELYLPVFPTVYPVIDVALKELKKVIIFNKLN